MLDGDCLYLLLLIIPFAPVVSVPASVTGGRPPSLSGCRQGPRMAPHDDDGDDGAGIRGGSIVESVCCSRGDGDDGDGWTVGDVLTTW